MSKLLPVFLLVTHNLDWAYPAAAKLAPNSATVLIRCAAHMAAVGNQNAPTVLKQAHAVSTANDRVWLRGKVYAHGSRTYDELFGSK